MALQDDDLLIVQKSGTKDHYKLKVSDLPSNGEGYVKLDGPDSPDNQTITGTGGLKTEGLLESASGVDVTSGDIVVDLGRVSASGSSTGQSFNATFKGTNSTALKGLFVSATSGSTATDVYGVQVGANLSNNVTKSGSAYGVHSSILNEEINSYNFYAAGDAPNFFKGDTLIGGTTAAPNIKLLSNGVGEFSGSGIFGSNISASNTNTGVNLAKEGIVTARRADGTNVWVGYKTGQDAGTSFVKSNGKMGLGGEPFANTVFQVTGSFAGDGGDGISIRTDAVLTSGNNNGAICGHDSRVSTTDTGSDIFHFRALGTQTATINGQSGFLADNTLISELTDQATPVRGFDSRLVATNERPNTYNFYAEGTAANFFAGDTYIGGNTTRNTRELWESTLTEEQKEQLAVGTLAVPANVSTPGDGEFARQWWYEQQDEETQALIDAGELEYPSHFQAANFVDTFALGDNTNINLLNTGSVECKCVEINGGVTPQTGFTLFNTKDRLLVRSDGTNVAQFLGTGQTTLSFDGTPNDVSPLEIRMKGAGTNGGGLKDDNAYIAWLPKTTNGDAIESAKFGPVLENDAGGTNNIACKFSFQLNSGSALEEKASISSSGMGSFEGGVSSENWTIAPDGTATGITVTRAAVVTDEQAGTVETLLDIITDLRARVEALEAAATN